MKLQNSLLFIFLLSTFLSFESALSNELGGGEQKTQASKCTYGTKHWFTNSCSTKEEFCARGRNSKRKMCGGSGVVSSSSSAKADARQNACTYGEYEPGKCRSVFGFLNLPESQRKQILNSRSSSSAPKYKIPNKDEAYSADGASKYIECYRKRWAKRYGGARSKNLCYRGVKHVLQDCGSSKIYLPGGQAKGAGPHLKAQGFKRLNIKDPRKAPLGAIIVYDNICRKTHPAGHIEIKLASNSYVSDYFSGSPRSEKTKCRPVKSIWYK